MADDLDGRLVDATAVGVDEQKAQEPVGKVENDFAAGMAKAARGDGRPERVLENVLSVRVAVEVVAVPVRAPHRIVTFEDADVAGHAGPVEAGADSAILRNVAGHVHLHEPLEPRSLTGNCSDS